MSEDSKIEEYPAVRAKRYLREDFDKRSLGKWERFRRNVKAGFHIDVYAFLDRLPPGDRDPVLIEMKEDRGSREVKSLFLIKREGREVEDLMEDLPRGVRVVIGDNFTFNRISGELEINQDCTGGLGGLKILKHEWAILTFFHELAHAEHFAKDILDNFPGLLERMNIEVEYDLIKLIHVSAIEEMKADVESNYLGIGLFLISLAKKRYERINKDLVLFLERLGLPRLDSYKIAVGKWAKDGIEKISSDEYEQLLASSSDRLAELERLRRERHLHKFSGEIACWARAREMKEEKEKEGFTIVDADDETVNQYIQLCLATHSSESLATRSNYRSILSEYEKARKQRVA